MPFEHRLTPNESPDCIRIFCVMCFSAKNWSHVIASENWDSSDVESRLLKISSSKTITVTTHAVKINIIMFLNSKFLV